MKRYFIPLGIFVVLAGFLFVGLGLDPREVPSPLINKPAPSIETHELHAPQRAFSQKDMAGQVWLMNVWASWCVACRQEHPLLVELSKTKPVPIVGLNYKDQPDAAKAWLSQWGDPYTMSVTDAEGRIGIDYGVYGVPETFLIDKAGVIRFKQIGPITPEIWQNKLLPMIEKLQRA